jgi:hypothetical protein
MENVMELGDRTAVQPRRLGDSVLARVFGASLDQSLADGWPPESSRLLAARARDIVDLDRRRSLASHWEHLLRVARRAQQAQRGWPPPAGAVPVRADRVTAAEPLIRDLISKLSAPLPVPARGVAMARALLTEANSPVYNRGARVALSAAVRAATDQLDPALPLMPSPGI